jgi:MoaA/NifB/PqqE/SkfB family radical SAM enzyme
MDSSSLSHFVRDAFQRDRLSWTGDTVRNDSGRELVLSGACLAVLSAILSDELPVDGGIEQVALIQLLAFYLLDRGSLSPVIDYASLLQQGPTFMQPSEVSLEITKLCNLRCLHCYNDSGKRDPAELSDDEKLAMVEYLGRWGVRRLSITGGEPTFDPSFPGLLSLGSHFSMSMKVTTNGWKLPDSMLAAVEEGTVVQVNLSLDGADAATHDAFRGRSGSYARVLRSMKLLAECRPQTLVLNVSVHAHSVHQMQALAGLAADSGFDAVSFKPVTSTGRQNGRHDFLLSLGDLRLFQAERARLGALYAGRLHVEGNILGGDVPESSLDEIKCNAAERSMLILSNGKMTPCAALNSGPWAPDIRDISPMHAWLTHPLFARFRSMKGVAGGSHVGCPGARFAISSRPNYDPALRVLQ